MRCMKLNGGRMKFHHLGWNHYSGGEFQKFIMPWSMREFHLFKKLSSINSEKTLLLHHCPEYVEILR